MLCPNCKKQILLIMEYNQIELDFCPECLGVWLDAEELQWILGANFDEQSLFTTSTINEVKKKCPRCRSNMHKVFLPENNQVIYDTCPNQHGFWFDRGELEILIHSLSEFPGTHSFLQWLTEVFAYSKKEK
ncbi:MAG: zf-TFIIB domain-containing protein [Candidatus Hydrogenedens sp.]